MSSSGRGKSKDSAGKRGKKAKTTTQSSEQGHTCVECKVVFEDDTDKMLLCEKCEEAWKCVKCLKLDDKTYTLMAHTDDIVYMCPPCKEALTQNEKETEQIATKIGNVIGNKILQQLSQMEQKIQTIESELTTKVDLKDFSKLDTDVKTMGMRVTKQNNDIMQLSNRIELLTTETEEIEKRKRNLIIKGLPENVMPDNELVALLFSKMKVEGEIQIQRLNRLGKVSETRSRFIKIQLRTENDKHNILKKATQIRRINGTDLPFNPQTVFISPDLTILQRERDKALRDKLAEAKKTNPDLMIKGNRIVKKNLQYRHITRNQNTINTSLLNHSATPTIKTNTELPDRENLQLPKLDSSGGAIYKTTSQRTAPVQTIDTENQTDWQNTISDSQLLSAMQSQEQNDPNQGNQEAQETILGSGQQDQDDTNQRTENTNTGNEERTLSTNIGKEEPITNVNNFFLSQEAADQSSIDTSIHILVPDTQQDPDDLPVSQNTSKNS